MKQLEVQERESFKRLEAQARGRVMVLMLGLGLAVATAICLRVEVLNSAAGGVLPRNVSKDGKWRRTYRPEEFLVTMAAARYRVTNRLAYDADLPAEIMAEIRRDVAPQVPRLVARNSLLGFLSGPGLFQYPLCLGIFAAGMKTAMVRQSRFGMASGLFAAALGVGFFSVACYRGYYSSLGW